MSPVKMAMQAKWYMKFFIFLAETSRDLLYFFINEILGAFWPANDFISAAHQASLVEPWLVFWRDVVLIKYPWRE